MATQEINLVAYDMINGITYVGEDATIGINQRIMNYAMCHTDEIFQTEHSMSRPQTVQNKIKIFYLTANKSPTTFDITPENIVGRHNCGKLEINVEKE